MLPKPFRGRATLALMAQGPIQLGWEHAPGAIHAHGALSGGVGVICVAGPVGSGKTTLARRLVARGGALLISTDDYLPDYHATPEHLRDEPGSARLDELVRHLRDLLAGRGVEVPVWSFHEHRRTGTRRVEGPGLVVVEGIHALHPDLDAVRSVGVLVEADRAVRWARWEAIESSGQRGWGVERARAFFDRVADPTFERHLPLYRPRADFVVRNDA